MSVAVSAPFVRGFSKISMFGLILCLLVGIGYASTLFLGDFYGYKARYQVESWQQERVIPAEKEIADALASINAALSWESENPEYVELKARITYYRALSKMPEVEYIDDINAALLLHKKAIQLRPNWPYSWANLALMYSYQADVGDRYNEAVNSAMALGPWEQSVNLTLTHAAMIAWPELSFQQKRLIALPIHRALKRNYAQVEALLGSYGRTLVVCAYLRRDKSQQQLCRK